MTDGSEFELPEGAEQTYAAIVDKAPVPPDAPGLTRLQALGLIVPNPVEPGKYVALDAQLAIRSHLAAEQAAFGRIARRMAGIAALDRLATRHDQARYWGGPRSEFLPTVELVVARIEESVSRAASEVLTAQPGYRKRPVIESAIARDIGLLQRGVRMQILYHASTRTNPNAQDYTTEVQAEGAEIRVMHGPFPQIIIIDGREAFIRNVASNDENDHSGWYVQDLAAVSYMREAYLMDWMRAEPWDESGRPTQGWLTERQRTILRMLAEGFEQVKIGNKIGISDRTVAGELAGLRAQLGLKTTLQLMVWYGRQQEA
ncbi:LuxR C-terminal-related transcriptional regulator [Streptomyces sp. SP18ES09]|uniref:LuxR C-terminal-related transcriptional regulator n=1 Tax=Streptomyces sp. SP18ES09 TaxID=3002532 RepID=UPI002E7A9B0C|nr:LuxR C-terminal-related transcriptional regulator [Streptomyces sp. SP18ES09]MEE1814268.1 LuxR C-terminal-related transcriptional regulator [Streptomyces sp. SP18ES09]